MGPNDDLRRTSNLHRRGRRRHGVLHVQRNALRAERHRVPECADAGHVRDRYEWLLLRVRDDDLRLATVVLRRGSFRGVLAYLHG